MHINEMSMWNENNYGTEVYLFSHRQMGDCLGLAFVVFPGR